MNIIITGPKHCGKSTIISKIIRSFSGSKSGFITEFDNRSSDSRKLLLRSIDGASSHCAAKWSGNSHQVYPEVFNTLAPLLVDPNADLIIIDELGKFEINCQELEAAVDTVFSSDANIIAAIRLDAIGWMQALKSRADVSVIFVTESNRDTLPEYILSLVGKR